MHKAACGDRTVPLQFMQFVEGDQTEYSVFGGTGGHPAWGL